MAMHDTRVFRDGKQWWVAQVLSASGGGWGPGPHPKTLEGAYFREIGNEENTMRHHTIPAGTLNRFNHSSILRVLKAAEPLGSGIRMVLSNPAHKEDWPPSTVIDDEGLEWSFRTTSLSGVDSEGSITNQSAVNFVCFDDSALKATVLMQSPTTLDDLRQTRGDHGILAIIDSIKSGYENYTPPDYDDE